MSSRSRVGSHWRRPATHVYDYNYKIGEHYYNPQLNYADRRYTGRAGSPPRAKTFAERFAEDPVYGDYGPPKWRTSTTGLGFGMPRRSSLGDEGGLGLGRRPLDEDSVFRRRRPLNEDDFFKRKPLDEDDFFKRKPLDEDEFFRRKPMNEEDLGLNDTGEDEFRRRRPRPPRFDFGEQLLDAVGARSARVRISPSPFRTGPGGETPRSARVLDKDPFEDEFFRRPRQRDARTAEPDLFREDPFKLRNAKAFGMIDEADDEFSRDADVVIGRIRSKLRARREKEEGLNNPSASAASASADLDLEDFGFSRPGQFRSKAKSHMADLEDDFGSSRLDQLRNKAKSHLAELGDDFAEFSIKPRRTAGGDPLSNLSSKYGADVDSGSSGSRSIHIKKRTVRTTFDED